MEQQTTRKTKTVVIFVLCALALQGIFCLFFTTGALEMLFPLYVRSAAQEVTVGDHSYTEYFRLRNEAAEAEVIVVGVDFTSPTTCDLITDMIVSLKHDAKIGAVIVDAYGDEISSVFAAEVINSIMPDAAEFTCQAMREIYDVSVAYEDLLDGMNSINLEYPPARRMFGVSILEGEDHTSALLHTVRQAYQESGRPVLLLTDATRLSLDDPLRVRAEAAAEEYLFIRCMYTNGVWDGVFSDNVPAVYLVERDDLRLFDNLYSAASTFTDGERREYSYSEVFSTEMFFVITDAVNEEENT